MGLVYSGLTCLLLAILTIYLLEDKGIDTGLQERICLFGLISLFILYNSYYGPVEDFLYNCRIIFMVPFLISISIVDARTRWVFDIDVVGGTLVSQLILGLKILEILLDKVNDVDKIGLLLYNNIIGLMLLVGLSYGLYRLTKGIGMGDVLVFAMVGTMGGWMDSLMVFFMSFISADLYCVVILINGINTGKRDGLIAFTPFISIGFIVTYEVIKLI